MKNKIIKVLEDNDIKFPITGLFIEDITTISYMLEGQHIITFSLRNICEGEDSYYLQCDYYSKAIGKTIIMSYDYQASYETAEELADKLISTQEEVNALESKLLTLNK